MVKAISKQMFGAKYESIGKSLIMCGILFFAIYTTEIKIMVAPFILYFTSTVFTICIMLQVLYGKHQVEMMQGLFTLPFENRNIVYSYVLALGSHTLITKTLLVWTLFFAVSEWRFIDVVVAIICGCNACLVSTTFYLLCKKRKLVLAIVWVVCILWVILCIRHAMMVMMTSLISIVGSIVYLSFADFYDFLKCISVKKIVRHTVERGNIIIYLVRYLLENKSYLLNTVALCVVSAFMPLLLGNFEGLEMLPLGFALLSLNTPICTLLSCDPDLEKSIRTLPKQVRQFCINYCLFIGGVNLLISCVYLGSWQLIYGGIEKSDFWMAILFALQSAFLSVFLEWVFPIHNWKNESDLWHHPRKYVVPFSMLLISVCIITWMPVIWIWSGILVVECCILIYRTRRFTYERFKMLSKM